MSWSIKGLLDWTTEYFKKYDLDHPHLEAEILLAHALKIPRLNLYLQFEKILDEQTLIEYKKLIIRRAKREPLAYITSNQPFMGLDLGVTPDVLIPRPETEELVQATIDLVKEKFVDREQITLIDVGTGSGAIAVSLAKFIRNSLVYGTDKSEKAILLAQQNAQKIGVGDRCRFVTGDLFADLKIKADLIISNPPYIPSSEIENLQPEIKDYEPRQALDGGPDGLDYYRKIAGTARNFLLASGQLIFEMGFGQADAVRNIFEENNFQVVKVIKDHSGIERIIAARPAPGL